MGYMSAPVGQMEGTEPIDSWKVRDVEGVRTKAEVHAADRKALRVMRIRLRTTDEKNT